LPAAGPCSCAIRSWRNVAPAQIGLWYLRRSNLGKCENGVEVPRVSVTQATSIPQKTCQAINLGYRDINSIDIARWKEDSDTLVVEEAGQVLYRLREAV
jgi:hypothetical protein